VSDGVPFLSGGGAAATGDEKMASPPEPFDYE